MFIFAGHMLDTL